MINKPKDIIYKLDNLKKRLIDISTKHLFGKEIVPIENNEIIVLCLVKNGEYYIREFIKHYQSLGVKHIIFLDNGSSDKTIEIAKEYSNISIFQTNFPFRKGNENRMKDYLMEKFGRQCWSFCLDIDEFFDYPYSDIVPLKELVKYLDDNSYTAVVTQMLDMFPEEIEKFRKKIFDRKEHCYYDNKDLIKKDYYLEQDGFINTKINIYSGGIRKTLFNTVSCVTKHVLLFYNDWTLRSRLGHYLFKGKIADFSAVLFHYKFNDDFFEYVKDAVEKEYHYANSLEYKNYSDVLKNNSSFRFKQKSSKELKNKKELIDNGFLVVSKRYMDFVKKFKNK